MAYMTNAVAVLYDATLARENRPGMRVGDIVLRDGERYRIINIAAGFVMLECRPGEGEFYLTRGGHVDHSGFMGRAYDVSDIVDDRDPPLDGAFTLYETGDHVTAPCRVYRLREGACQV